MAYKDENYQKKYYIKNKEKISAVNQKWCENNREKSRAIKTKWRKDNREQVLEINRQYHKNNVEKEKEYKKRYYLENKEERLKYGKKYREENPEYYLKYNREWSKTEKGKISQQKSGKKYNKTEKGIAKNQRGHSERRTRERKIINTLTSQEWLDILEAYNYRCAYCDVEFEVENMPHKDHVIPISKGGHNTKENIVPTCQSCNSKKGNKSNYKPEVMVI